MNLNELIALMASEFRDGLPAAVGALHASDFTGHADAYLDSLAPVTEHLARSRAAVELVNLQSASQLFAHADAAVAHAAGSNDSTLRQSTNAWIEQMLLEVDRYLDAGASVQAAESLYHTAAASPALPSAEWLDAFVATLLIEPSFAPTLEDDEAREEFAELTPEQLSLDISSADPDLVAALLADAPRQLERLRADLLAYENAAARNVGMLAEAQRVAHTFKGSGNIIGIPGIANVAHPLEDLLSWLDGTTEASPESQCAVRDALSSTNVLEQSVGYLSGEEDAPQNVRNHAERLREWTLRIRSDDVLGFVPPPIAMIASGETSAQQTIARENPEAAGAQSATMLRIPTERVSEMLTRAGQSLASTQRTARTLRGVDEKLMQAAANRSALRKKLEELQRLVERQVVALEDERTKSDDFDPLELDRYDQLYVLSRNLAEAIEDQDQINRQAENDVRDTLLSLRDEERELREQHRSLLASRLVPFSSVTSRLRRSVEQTAEVLEKQVQFTVVGQHASLDADVLSQLTEPLLHVLRNAVDHGIESAEARRIVGKAAVGTVAIECARDGSYVTIVCRDDGRGIDEFAVREKAIREGLIQPDTILSSSETVALVMQRGFSTRDAVSQVSGRGIGMDVVAERIRALKGTVRLASSPGSGTTITLRVPVSTGLALALVVDVADERFAIASDNVIAALPPGSVQVVESASGTPQASVEFSGSAYTVQSLAALLGLEESPTPDAMTALSVVLVRADQGIAAFGVRRVSEVREFVLQDVGSLMRRIPGLNVGSIGDAGKPMFFIDPSSLLERAANKVSLSAAVRLRRRAEAETVRILVVDDALSARRALQQAFQNHGFEALAASDGFEAIEVLRKERVSLIATDLEMPNLNGLELTRRVRENPEWAHLPVIMVTSRGGERHRDTALAAGVNRYLTKPFSDTQLLAEAKSLLAPN